MLQLYQVYTEWKDARDALSQRTSTDRQSPYLKQYLLSMVSEGGKTLKQLTQLTESLLVNDEGKKLIPRILDTLVEEGRNRERNGVFTKIEISRQQRMNYV